MKFQVIRQHFGDRQYMPGDTREANEVDVKHLIDAGVLRKVREKAESAAPMNKAERRAPRDKSGE